MASFTLPELQEENPNSLFGPNPSNLPTAFVEIPYQTFSKSERLGNIVDWSASLSIAGSGPSDSRSYTRRVGTRAPLEGDITGLYGYRNEEDESSFSLVGVDSRATTLRTTRQGGALGNIGRNANYARTAGGAARAGSSRLNPINARSSGAQPAPGPKGQSNMRGGLNRRGFGRGGYGGRDWGRDNRSRESSIVVGEKWNLLEEIEFSRLSKLRLDVETEDVETLSQYGFLYEYDRTYDRVNTKNEKPITHMERLRYYPTASDDPVLQDLASKDRAKVFTTDAVLTTLMCASRSVYPWDIVLVREGDKLFMDKREQGPLDYLTVNENASDPPMEVTVMDPSNPSALINTPSALSQQATFLNENFRWQVVKESQDASTKLEFEKPNPFYDPDESEPLASCGYRYRRFDLSITEDEEIDLVVRTEVDALLRGTLSGTSTISTSSTPSANSEEETYITINTLFEFDSRAQGSGGAPNWRAKLDSQRGAVVATEMKNNSFKLAKWATQGILSGAGGMKIGYVSRANPRELSRHVILGTQWFKPRDLAAQMNVSLSNGWGIVRTIIDLCMKQKNGKYILLKDPNKPVIRLYQVPMYDEAEEEELEGQEGEEEAAGSDY